MKALIHNLTASVLLALICVITGHAQVPDTVYGPADEPPGGVFMEVVGTLNDELISRSAGKDITFSTVSLAAYTDVYFATKTDSVRLSMNGGEFTGGEILSFNASLSDLPAGKVVWNGQTRTVESATPVYTRFTMLVRDANDNPVPLVDPAFLNQDPYLGGMAQIISRGVLKVNLKFTASYNQGSGFIPALDFSDQYSNADGMTYSSFGWGWYWINAAPRLQTNDPIQVDEGDTAWIDHTHLQSFDYESPESEQYFYHDGSENHPANGALMFGEEEMEAGDTATMEVIRSGQIMYIHDDSETSSDSMRLSLVDGDGKAYYDIEGDSLFWVYFDITPIDDPPELTVHTDIETTEGGEVTITPSHLTAEDDVSAPGAIHYTIDPDMEGTWPKYGIIKKSGIPVSPGDQFTQQDLADSKITYKHDGTENASDGFVFSVQDESGHLAENNGTTTFFSDIVVTLSNDKPVFSANVPTEVDEGGTTVISPANLNAVDEESDAAHITFTLDPETSVPAFGTLFLESTALAPGDAFTVQDIMDGKVSYTHDGSEEPEDELVLSIMDEQGALAEDNGHTTFKHNILVSQVNDTPSVVTPHTDLEYRAEEAFTFTLDVGIFHDPDPGDELSYSLTMIDGGALPSWLSFDPGTHELSGTPPNSEKGDHHMLFTAQDLAGAQVSDTIIFTILPAVDVEEHAYAERTVYPNPGNGRFEIRTNGTYESYTVLSITGATIRSGTLKQRDKLILDLSDHAEGVYFLLMRDGDGDGVVEKLIKQ